MSGAELNAATWPLGSACIDISLSREGAAIYVAIFPEGQPDTKIEAAIEGDLPRPLETVGQVQDLVTAIRDTIRAHVTAREESPDGSSGDDTR